MGDVFEAILLDMFDFPFWFYRESILSFLDIFSNLFLRGLKQMEVCSAPNIAKGHRCPFRLIWLEIDGLDWFYFICKGTPSILPKGHLWHGPISRNQTPPQ